MPDYNEEAIRLLQQQQMLAQMSPEQKLAYQKQYEAYMLQVQQQEEMMRQQAEYERQIKEGGGVPPVSAKTQSRIEKLKEQFEKKRIQDSIAAVNKGIQIK